MFLLEETAVDLLFAQQEPIKLVLSASLAIQHVSPVIWEPHQIASHVIQIELSILLPVLIELVKLLSKIKNNLLLNLILNLKLISDGYSFTVECFYKGD